MTSDDASPAEHVSLLTGTLPGGEQVLVTVWSDGTAEVAFRPTSAATWGPPTLLIPQQEVDDMTGGDPDG